jgi:hypothetical protein
MKRVPMGRDREFSRLNVGRWMRKHGTAADFRELATEAAMAFDVHSMLDGFEPSDRCNLTWVWDVAVGVVAEREGNHAFAS